MSAESTHILRGVVKEASLLCDFISRGDVTIVLQVGY